MEQQPRGKNKKGYVLLVSVIFLGSIILSLSLYFSWLASFMLRNGIDFAQAQQAEYLADLCVETALQELWDDGAFTGSLVIADSGGECSYQVNNTGGENRQINATGIVNGKTKKMQVAVDAVNANVSVSSWKIVADFN
ncbi:MAG: hypothetical protein IPN70_03085 [Candidatus Moraniibacteriota bacterium]|nr:MAG: hypothetical protein IPN70_03085 [Candidatus Moranbacteria bacterium]